jgi:2-keto-3-deoxy-L-rhamnonate aldolase RhmA
VSGILAFDTIEMSAWIKKGMRFAAYSSDVNMLADAAQAALKELKAAPR